MVHYFNVLAFVYKYLQSLTKRLSEECFFIDIIYDSNEIQLVYFDFKYLFLFLLKYRYPLGVH